MTDIEYKPQKIEDKCQKRWQKDSIFEVNMDTKEEKFYVLEMYPYPSSKLHKTF